MVSVIGHSFLFKIIWHFEFELYLCGVSQTKETYINISKGGFFISIRLCYIQRYKLFVFPCWLLFDMICSFLGRK
nr:MAG TPA: hypothetical protein [Caudoviricetes sp.]